LVAISADGGTLITAGTVGVIAFARDGGTGELRRTGCLGGPGCPPLTTVARVSAVLVAADGARVLLADSDADTVTVVANGAAGLRELGCLRERGSFGPGRCVERSALDGPGALAASPDGGFVYAGVGSGAVSLPEGGGW
jgi:DNA-binding beta-propeller fold protein YncE